jgi:RHS repeat-associated protein
VVVTNGVATKALSYDANGNLTSLITPTSTNNYEWDAEDRLVAVNVNAHRSEFSYDGQWRRVRILEVESGVTNANNVFLWTGVSLAEMRNTNGSMVEKHFAGEGERLSTTNYFYTRDHLGSVREMLDGTNGLRARYDFGPYGQRVKTEGSLQAAFGFTGHFAHQNSDLQLALFRGYDATTSRWLSNDPLGESAGLNLARYVENDPVNQNDPLGLESWMLFGYYQGGQFIYQPPPWASPPAPTSTTVNTVMMNKIMQKALSQVGSHEWDYDVSNFPLSRGDNKCNLFVGDMLSAGGVSIPHLHTFSPPSAAEWENTNVQYMNWVILSNPIPGAIISFRGHVGIVGPGGTSSISATAHGVTNNDWGFRSNQRNPGPVYRGYTGPTR